MTKEELITKQQLEIEGLKTEILNIKDQLKPVLNQATMLQQYDINHDKFNLMSMNLAISCRDVIYDIVGFD